MFFQFLKSLIDSIVVKTITTYHNWSHLKFYFITSLLFIFGLALIYRDTVVTMTRDLIVNEIQFRECRDITGLTNYMSKTMLKDSVVKSYTIYLYQPVNSSIYKKIIVSNDITTMSSPVLQGIYLKTQPTINKELQQHSYWLANRDELLSHEDTRYWISINPDTRLSYALKIDSKVIGEVWIDFKTDPTPLQLERVLKEISPALYTYVL